MERSLTSAELRRPAYAELAKLLDIVRSLDAPATPAFSQDTMHARCLAARAVLDVSIALVTDIQVGIMAQRKELYSTNQDVTSGSDFTDDSYNG